MSKQPMTLTVAEAAEELRTHRQTVYRLIWANVLPWVNIGTGSRPRIRITREAVRNFTEARERVA